MENDLPAGPDLRLLFDEASRTLSASLAPDPRFPRIDALWLRSRLAAAHHADLQIRPEPIKQLIARYNAGEAVPPIEIAHCVDASLQIMVSLDGLSARLTLIPPKGGKPATKVDVLTQIQAKGIVEGVLVDEINRAIAEGKADDLVIARGREPLPGEDGKLESLLPETRERVPSVNASGRTDYRDLGEVQIVRAGDALMRRHPPTRGTEGLSVLGRPLPAKAGRDARFAAGLRGVAPSVDDPDLLVAATDGQPVQVKGGVIVEPVYTVDTVNLATGNINFDGTVRVRNDVQAGMSIRATGDIEVGGTVEPATLEADGNIVVKGGVLGGLGGKTAGKDMSAHAIRCGGSFSAGYAQQARISAGDSIFIDDLAMQCQLDAANHIRIGNLRRGHIIGGLTRACLSIHARVIGAPNRVRTEIEVGNDPALAQAAQEKAAERDGKENKLLEIGKLLTVADRNPGKVSPEIIARAEESASALSGEIESLRSEEEDLRHRLMLTQQARVNAESAIHEGVSVSMGDKTLRIPHERGASTIRLAEQGLGLFALEDDSHLTAPQRPGPEAAKRR
ncbi:FapA family protein [Thauera sp.]|jgi:uncharacterized protein (DUF342 family)|uniref:DUF342 domain-containing protein n=1 Tax=Thauera sp. TaxID=1905334 RepID=UPI002A36047E|nr:FapA family protein [Thauera sp.]MDX9886189.1 FapA family protein [Thauera sp.]